MVFLPVVYSRDAIWAASSEAVHREREEGLVKPARLKEREFDVEMRGIFRFSVEG